MRKVFCCALIVISCAFLFAQNAFAACPCSVWGPTNIPAVVDSGDTSGVELGTKFRADQSGYVTGVRFYKSANNTGTHIGNLWDGSGNLLGSATFANESNSGWQQMNFSTPIAIAAGTTYIVSYYTPSGHYSFDAGFFSAAGVDNAPLHALQNGVDGGNGVYAYGSQSSFPSSSYNSSNYWVDVVYLPASGISAPIVSSTVPAASSNGANVNGTISATFNQPMNAATMTAANFIVTDASNNIVPGTVSFSPAASTFSFAPNTTLNGISPYTATVKAAVSSYFGQAMGADYSWTFTTGSAPATGNCPCSIWASTATPSLADSGDGGGIEVGVKFTVDFNGYVTGVRFYKSAANTGTHIGNLWTLSGAKLATVTFTNESGSGWQQGNFSTPVSVVAGTTYVVSYYAPNGHYSYNSNFFASAGVDNPPVHALANGGSGGDGVYNYASASTFPSSTYGAANYWVDLVYFQSNSTTAPSVSGTLPTNGGSGGNVGGPVQATFNQPMNASTITAANFTLVDSSNNSAPGTVSYDAASATASFVPTQNLRPLSTYTASIKNSVQNFLGRAMSSNYSWNFTTSKGCPCSIWTANVTPGTIDSGDGTSSELGVKFRADSNGYIIGLRFYKGASNTGVHIGNIWTSSGGLLGSATFQNETSSGWQQVTFSNPIPVTAGLTYVASYFAPAGHYSYDSGYFSSTGVDNSPLHALMNGVDGPDGVYAYAASNTFPTSTFGSSNYWVDVIFTQNTSEVAPLVTTTTPTNGTSSVNLGEAITATFSQPMNASTMTAANFLVADSSNQPVQGTVTYDPGSLTVSFQPNPGFSALTTYTATVKGAVLDANGHAMGADYSWSFTTSAPPPNSGPGGPILVISTLANPFTKYLDEILLAEGLNEFTDADISGATANTLSAYDVVILGDMKLTAPQASMLTTWVMNGGNLIAMHPDKQLAGLFGLTSTSNTLSEAYLAISTTAAPGQGIVSTPIQFHGTADLYSTNGATTVATLYSSSTTRTSSPAVVWKVAGAGHAAAFTYDLARSVVYTRQGNPAWAGQFRYVNTVDTPCPGCTAEIATPVDLFYGNASFDPRPDWNNLNNVAIPQADEQQRLLANMIQFLNLGRKPFPRFWYLPSGYKAAVIMTGDDHDYFGTTGTAARFNQYIADSTPGCSLADWKCIRATSYIFPEGFGGPPISLDYKTFVAQGFEIANHGDTLPTCINTTPDVLDSSIATELAQLAQNYPGLPAPQTNRSHCILWPDYDSEPRILLKYGIRFDTTYYYYPESWVQDRAGMLNGSGFPMRFADRNGNTINVYQALTQMPDEANDTYPAFVNTLLNNALGTPGYYGVFTANMHTDNAESPGSDAIASAAQAQGVPVITSLQMLTWLDGRNNSAFGSLSWSSNTLSFSITAATGSRNIQAMVPMKAGTTTLRSIKKSGVTVSFTTQTIKGLQYAFFAASTGSYTATYQ